MAKIVVARNQQLAMAAEHPKPYYSRVVSVWMGLIPGAALTYSVTPTVGNKVWLLGVKVWCDLKATDRSQLSYFKVYAGSGKPSDAEDVKKWTNILPVYSSFAADVNWGIYDGSPGIEWPMMRFFEGSERRFGIVAGRSGEDLGDLCASFEISEG